MLNNLFFFAHAQNQHDGTSESVSHYLESAPIAVLVWAVAATSLLLFVINVLKMKRPTRLLTLAVFNLGYGVFLYDKAPEVGALIISLGFAATLWSVLLGLQEEPQQPVKKGQKNGKR